jgi:hypothetical protein
MNVIIDTPEAPKVLYNCIVKRAELLELIKHREISPYTGTVDPETKEYEALMGIFDRKFRILEILKDKEAKEKVIMEREKQKTMKIQTKTIAQEAIHA